MRKLAIIAAILLQVAVLAYMAGQREYILRTGRIVFLKTAPVDPRDIFRGDYVRLQYEISTVKGDLLRDGLVDLSKNDLLGSRYIYERRDEWRKIRGRPVYGLLSVGADDIADLVSLTDKKPADGLFIRGRIEYPGFGSLNVRYGIEAYFIEQGKGKEIEKAMFQSMRVPLEMEVALGKNGTAVLKGYRWSPLGISIERDVNGISVEKDAGSNKRLKGVTVKLLNNSNKPIGIIDLPDGQSFALEPQGMFGMFAEPKVEYKWVGAEKERKKVEDSDVRILEPGKVYELYIDVNQPQWFVARGDGQGKSISDVIGRFRLVYRPPSQDECKDLQKADLIWHGCLESPAFEGGSWRGLGFR
jgi:uncharacterized membrane-anchored protein